MKFSDAKDHDTMIEILNREFPWNNLGGWSLVNWFNVKAARTADDGKYQFIWLDENPDDDTEEVLGTATVNLEDYSDGELKYWASMFEGDNPDLEEIGANRLAEMVSEVNSDTWEIYRCYERTEAMKEYLRRLEA